ncbi:MAG: hypothetical protein KIT84_21025 [Labilithrix sp.]|nr:hypothetical protein [Labilithrix sp.]MCW5813526.1 hypothetical protein [Labilithrix sp.]
MSDHQKPSDRDVTSVRIAASERASSIDPRAHQAWRTWLAALAKDADAVTAAALAYESLDADGRSAWLDALDHDAPDVEVPKIALYAPLLGVEEDDERRARIVLNVVGAARKSTPPRAWVGRRGEDRVCLVVTPLYLDFVEILCCRYDPDVGVRDAWHKWLAHTSDVAKHGAEVGAQEEALLPEVVEELAHAVVADRRAGRNAPPSLVRYMDLFAPDLAHPARSEDE